MRIWVLIFTLFVALPVQADSTDRLKSLYSQIRCPVCDGQSVEDSEATLAQDLRRVVYTMAEKGKSDSEIKGFLVQRYGQQILLRPEFRWENAALWGFPFGVLLLIGGILTMMRRRSIRSI